MNGKFLDRKVAPRESIPGHREALSHHAVVFKDCWGSEAVRCPRTRCLSDCTFFRYSVISIDLPKVTQLVSNRDKIDGRREE